jgi:hypothetical protein
MISFPFSSDYLSEESTFLDRIALSMLNAWESTSSSSSSESESMIILDFSFYKAFS